MEDKKINAFKFLHDGKEIVPEKSLLDLIEQTRSITFMHDDLSDCFDQIEFCSIDEDQCLVAINKSGDRLVGFVEGFSFEDVLLVAFDFS